MNFRSTQATLDPSDAIYRQIADRVREKILKGDLKSGLKMPTTEEMANEWGTNVRTMHLALSQLVKEGLLTRVPRRGTFVRAREKYLTHVGIYVNQELSMSPVCRFYQEIITNLGERMERLDIRHSLWIDTRPRCKASEPWEKLHLAARQQDIQGAIAVSSTALNRDWLTRLPIPIAHLGGSELSTDVMLDSDQFFTLSLQRLKDKGCKTAGIIGGISPEKLETFLHIAKEQDIEVRDEWTRTPPSFIEPNLREQWGYEQFLAFWSLENRPEGLIVFEDIIARGVITAVLVRQVDVPGELKLVLHRNTEIPLLCPVAASFVESSCAEVAEALLQQLQREFRKERTKPILVPFRHARN